MTGRRPVPVEEALALVAGWMAAGERIALVCGCFDLPSASDVHALAAARGRAARVLVAVRDDAAAARLLGTGRPVVGAAERARLIAALRGIDAVVVADDAAALALRDAIGRAGETIDVDAASRATDVRARVLAAHRREAR